jgi:hypothetical protein
MVTCIRCDCNIGHGDEYVIVYNEIYCVHCSEDLGVETEVYTREIEGRKCK